MQSHRLARLLRIIVEIKNQPNKPPEQLAGELGISLRQFYYDRQELAERGFRFSRTKGRFAILNDPVVTIRELPLSEVLALVLATRHLFATKDFSIVRRALNGLYIIVDHMPESQRGPLRSLIRDVIIKDGFGCEPHILEDIVRAVDEKRRVVVHFRHGARGRSVALDPFELCLRKSKLFLDAYAVERKRRSRFRVATMERVVFTPFYRPENGKVHSD